VKLRGTVERDEKRLAVRRRGDAERRGAVGECDGGVGGAVGIEDAELVGAVAGDPVTSEGVAGDVARVGIRAGGVLGEFGAGGGVEDRDGVCVGIDDPETTSIGILADGERAALGGARAGGRGDDEQAEGLGDDGAVTVADLDEDAGTAGSRVGVLGGR
jgi:hypothetical protein